MASLSTTQKILFYYCLSMLVALALTYLWSWFDLRTLRDVGIWAKPMKFMAAFKGVAGLIIVTSFFEVAYISLQAARGEPSHYNTNDAFHIFMFALMGVMAVGLTASQAWLAWLIWSDLRHQTLGNHPRRFVGLGFDFCFGNRKRFSVRRLPTAERRWFTVGGVALEKRPSPRTLFRCSRPAVHPAGRAIGRTLFRRECSCGF